MNRLATIGYETDTQAGMIDRLKAAADSQGFKFDRHAARNELQAATFGKRRPVVARLLLSPTGAMAIEVRAED